MSAIRPVVCVGALHVDAKARVLGPVRTGTSNPANVTRTPGGVACNVARSLARLGVPVSLVSVVGDDEIGRGLLSRLAGEGVGIDDVIVLPDAATAGYTAVLDEAGALVLGIADMSIYDRLDAAVVAPAVARYGGSALWCADANPAPGGLAALAPVAATLHLDPVSVAKAPRLRSVLAGSAAVFPDAAEAAALTGCEDAAEAAAVLLQAGTGRVVVTLGPAGVFDSATAARRPAVASGPIADVTGAGDALLAGFLAAIARGESDPLGWGLAAASLAVETLETVPGDLSVAKVQERLG
ncbi:MAG: carbohydrate kinase [Acidimicrobiia bacterium]|nr:carbohydrate kinase [Acidimicrobiia bacterium]